LALRFFAVAAAFLGLVMNVSATPFVPPPACPGSPGSPATLADYLALDQNGCSIGFLAFSGFDFTVLDAQNVTPLNPTEIFLTPTFDDTNKKKTLATLAIESEGFSVTGDQAVSYGFRFLVDPHPEIFEYDSSMSTFTPVAPGQALITTDLCIDSAFLDGPFTNTNCDGTFAQQSLFHKGLPNPVLTASTSFAKTAVLDVHTTITLQANGASADIKGVVTTSVAEPEEGGNAGEIPEPSTGFLVVSGAVLAALGKRRLSR
jgi:hypothetical protein